MPPFPTPQISEKLSQLQSRRQETADKWQEKMDWLQLGEPLWDCQQEGGACEGRPWHCLSVVATVHDARNPGCGIPGSYLGTS